MVCGTEDIKDIKGDYKKFTKGQVSIFISKVLIINIKMAISEKHTFSASRKDISLMIHDIWMKFSGYAHFMNLIDMTHRNLPTITQKNFMIF